MREKQKKVWSDLSCLQDWRGALGTREELAAREGTPGQPRSEGGEGCDSCAHPHATGLTRAHAARPERRLRGCETGRAPLPGDPLLGKAEEVKTEYLSEMMKCQGSTQEWKKYLSTSVFSSIK